MNTTSAIIYGVIQGLSEFLPISSSGHLALLPHLLQINDPGVTFDLCMHVGTALAVIIYFRNDLFKMVTSLKDNNFSKNFILATFVSVVFILAFLPISKMMRDPKFIIFNLSFFGILLAVSERYSQKKMNEPLKEKIQIKDVIIIGFAQALAIFPGVSRSGITLTAAFFRGYERNQAAQFSFLLSLPIIIAGALKEVPKVLKGGEQFEPMILLVGIFTSFIVGFLTIHFFMKLISKIKLIYFAIYRIGIALLMYLIIF